jgi:hypothetical protein
MTVERNTTATYIPRRVGDMLMGVFSGVEVMDGNAQRLKEFKMTVT